VLGEHRRQRCPHAVQLRAVERAGPVERRVAGREQEPVALTERHVEGAREPDDHLPAGLRAAGLDEADVARRRECVHRKVELALAADAPPVSQQVSELDLWVRHRHAAIVGAGNGLRASHTGKCWAVSGAACSGLQPPQRLTGDEMTMQLTIYDSETAPDGSKATLEGIAADLGFVPNVAGTAAGSPALLSGFDGLRRAVGSGELDPVVREVAGVAVGVAVDNHYGVAFHSTVLGNLGLDDAEIERMRAGEPPADHKLAAVYELAQGIVLERGKVSDDVIAEATSAGLTTPEILEIVAECTFAGLVGTLDNLAGRVELDEFLAPRAWT
jgi:alkylhydroperoxidase family enzyme